MKETRGRITFETGLRPKPEPHEINAARIIAEYFNAEVLFIRRRAGATPDIKVKGRVWELKSPKGDGKRTMSNNLREADGQSENVIIDLSRCKMKDARAISRIKAAVREGHYSIWRLKVITKEEKIIDIL